MHNFAPITPVILQRPCLPHTGQRRFPYLLAGLLLLVQGCATTPPAPNPAEKAHAEAKAAYLAHDYQRTLAIVEPLAIAGEPWAQYTLGYMYHYGRGVTMDKQMAKQWIQRAAEQGYAPAQQALQRISSHPPPTETDMGSSAKDGKAPSAASSEDKQQLQQSTSQEATDTAMAPPAAAPAMAATATPEIAPEQPEAGAKPSAMQSPDMASAAPPAESTPPQETASTAMPEPSAPPSAMTPHPVEAVPAKSAPMAEQPVNGVKGREWIAAQDPQHFTVQLIGVGSQEAVVRFIRKHGLEERAAYFSMERNGQPWFVAVYGSFSSRDDARQALQRLPSSLRSASPWIRSFHDIQALSTP